MNGIIKYRLPLNITLAIIGYYMFFNWSKDFAEHGYGYIPFIILLLSVNLTLMIGYDIKNRFATKSKGGEGEE